MDQNIIQTFVARNVLPARDGRKCVDGRYEGTELDEGMIACPGADFGFVMVLLALNRGKNWGLTPEECADKVFNALTENGDVFYLHTDLHASEDGKIGYNGEIGCGHCARAMRPELSGMYLLNPDDSKNSLEQIRKLQIENSDKIVIINLRGDHKEEGILDVKNTDKTVASQDTEHMFFLYDSTRHALFIEDLVPLLEIPGLTVDDFKQVAQTQLQATLRNLALGKQIFEIKLTEELPQVTPGPTIQ